MKMQEMGIFHNWFGRLSKSMVQGPSFWPLRLFDKKIQIPLTQMVKIRIDVLVIDSYLLFKKIT
jgi:hypothetical protein